MRIHNNSKIFILIAEFLMVMLVSLLVSYYILGLRDLFNLIGQSFIICLFSLLLGHALEDYIKQKLL